MLRKTKKVLIAVAGTLVVIIGLLLVPYPGPGWLIVFAGLALLSTEFLFAKKVLDKARRWYDAWLEWLKKQPWVVKVLVLAATGAVILTTLWLLDAFGMIAALLDSPYEDLVDSLIIN